MNFSFGNGANSTTALAKIIQITQLERIPTTVPNKYAKSIVEPKKESRATILASLVFLDNAEVRFFLANSTLFAAENRLQTEPKESIMAKVYI
ncbi:MAG: hypothetical protein AAGA43_01940 [Bacteroidota bacterium]